MRSCRRKGASRSCAPGCAALAPPGPKRPAGWVSEDGTQQGIKEVTIRMRLRMTAGAVLFAVLIWGVLAAPGFLSDRDSTVLAAGMREALR